MDFRISPDELEQSIAVLKRHKTHADVGIKELASCYVTSVVRRDVVPAFMKLIDAVSLSAKLAPSADVVRETHAAFCFVLKQIDGIVDLFKDCNVKDWIIIHFRVLLFADPDERLLNAMKLFYSAGLRCFIVGKQRGNCLPCRFQSDESSTLCPGGCKKLRSNCVCASLSALVMQTNAIMIALGIMDSLACGIMHGVLRTAVEDEIKALTEQADDRTVVKLQDLMDPQLFQFLNKAYDGELPGNRRNFFTPQSLVKDRETRRRLSSQRRHLECVIKEIYTNWVLGELHWLIDCHPSGAEALSDFKSCFDDIPQLRLWLTRTCRQILSSQLLNVATSTQDILIFYLKLVQLLRSVDSTGVILQTVSASVRDFLKKRDDTVRCILSLITEPPAGPLGKSLDLGAAAPLDADSEEAMVATPANWLKWEPDPIDVLHLKGEDCHKDADLVALLVGIYGSKEVFVQEYTSLLAERLLRNSSLNVDKDASDLEKIKKRFTDADLSKCKVMLHDAKQSESLVREFQEKVDCKLISIPPEITTNLSAMIMSSQFWPSVKESRLNLPSPIATLLNVYKGHYEVYQASRTVEWHPHLGLVELQLRMCGQGKPVKFTVSPLLACVVHLFSEKETWQLSEIASRLQTYPSATRRLIYYWVSAGVIREASPGSESFTLTESLPSSSTAVDTQVDMDVDLDDSHNDGFDAMTELEAFWLYISGLLRNMSTLTAERIFTMLSFVSEQPLTLDHVVTFLNEKVRGGHLLSQSGQYMLPKR